MRSLLLCALAACTFLAVSEAYVVKASNVECQICLYLVQQVANDLGTDVTDEEKKLDQDCTKDFGALAGICENIVNKELDKIESGLQNGQDANTICQDIDMCNKSNPLKA